VVTRRGNTRTLGFTTSTPQLFGSSSVCTWFDQHPNALPPGIGRDAVAPRTAAQFGLWAGQLLRLRLRLKLATVKMLAANVQPLKALACVP
jgi:hypothetical protein